MILSTKVDQDGFSIRLDDRVLFKVASLPESFAFQLSDTVTYFLSREPRDFLNRSKYLLIDTSKREVARITGEFFGGLILGSKLFVGEKQYRIKPKAKSFFNIGGYRGGYRVDELGIVMDSYRPNDSFLSIFRDANEVRTSIQEDDEQKIAVIVLLHFARFWKWKEQT